MSSAILRSLRIHASSAIFLLALTLSGHLPTVEAAFDPMMNETDWFGFQPFSNYEVHWKLSGLLTSNPVIVVNMTLTGNMWGGFGQASSGMKGHIIVCYYGLEVVSPICYDYQGRNYGVTQMSTQTLEMVESSRIGNVATIVFNTPLNGSYTTMYGLQRYIFATSMWNVTLNRPMMHNSTNRRPVYANLYNGALIASSSADPFVESEYPGAASNWTQMLPAGYWSCKAPAGLVTGPWAPSQSLEIAVYDDPAVTFVPLCNAFGTVSVGAFRLFDGMMVGWYPDVFNSTDVTFLGIRCIGDPTQVAVVASRGVALINISNIDVNMLITMGNTSAASETSLSWIPEYWADIAAPDFDDALAESNALMLVNAKSIYFFNLSSTSFMLYFSLNTTTGQNDGERMRFYPQLGMRPLSLLVATTFNRVYVLALPNSTDEATYLDYSQSRYVDLAANTTGLSISPLIFSELCILGGMDGYLGWFVYGDVLAVNATGPIPVAPVRQLQFPTNVTRSAISFARPYMSMQMSSLYALTAIWNGTLGTYDLLYGGGETSLVTVWDRLSVGNPSESYIKVATAVSTDSWNSAPVTIVLADGYGGIALFSQSTQSIAVNVTVPEGVTTAPLSVSVAGSGAVTLRYSHVIILMNTSLDSMLPMDDRFPVHVENFGFSSGAIALPEGQPGFVFSPSGMYMTAVSLAPFPALPTTPQPSTMAPTTAAPPNTTMAPTTTNASTAAPPNSTAAPVNTTEVPMTTAVPANTTASPSTNTSAPTTTSTPSIVFIVITTTPLNISEQIRFLTTFANFLNASQAYFALEFASGTEIEISVTGPFQDAIKAQILALTVADYSALGVVSISLMQPSTTASPNATSVPANFTTPAPTASVVVYTATFDHPLNSTEVQTFVQALAALLGIPTSMISVVPQTNASLVSWQFVGSNALILNAQFSAIPSSVAQAALGYISVSSAVVVPSTAVPGGNDTTSSPGTNSPGTNSPGTNAPATPTPTVVVVTYTATFDHPLNSTEVQTFIQALATLLGIPTSSIVIVPNSNGNAISWQFSGTNPSALNAQFDAIPSATKQASLGYTSLASATNAPATTPAPSGMDDKTKIIIIVFATVGGILVIAIAGYCVVSMKKKDHVPFNEYVELDQHLNVPSNYRPDTGTSFKSNHV